MRRYLPDACDYAPENVYLKFHLFSMKTKTRLKNSTQFNNRISLPHSHLNQLQNKHCCHLDDLVLCL